LQCRCRAHDGARLPNRVHRETRYAKARHSVGGLLCVHVSDSHIVSLFGYAGDGAEITFLHHLHAATPGGPCVLLREPHAVVCARPYAVSRGECAAPDAALSQFAGPMEPKGWCWVLLWLTGPQHLARLPQTQPPRSAQIAPERKVRFDEKSVPIRQFDSYQTSMNPRRFTKQTPRHERQLNKIVVRWHFYTQV
jgi:hypothetical protein